tara:strand:+ start:465 stop:860 length:396 start_codon:yes stop_codon:yes gene_type:complete
MKKNSKILIVRSEYNDTADMEIITNKTIDANKELKRTTIVVKGAFEIPVTIAKNIDKYDGFIAIGIIIKGETTNFSLISQSITHAIMNLSISSKKPIGNAVLTCLTKKQAAERVAKGEEAANAVIDILRQN